MKGWRNTYLAEAYRYKTAGSFLSPGMYRNNANMWEVL